MLSFRDLQILSKTNSKQQVAMEMKILVQQMVPQPISVILQTITDSSRHLLSSVSEHKAKAKTAKLP